jgi:hypothetical protein
MPAACRLNNPNHNSGLILISIKNTQMKYLSISILASFLTLGAFGQERAAQPTL